MLRSTFLCWFGSGWGVFGGSFGVWGVVHDLRVCPPSPIRFGVIFGHLLTVSWWSSVRA